MVDFIVAQETLDSGSAECGEAFFVEAFGRLGASKQLGVSVAEFVGDLFGEKRGDAQSLGGIDCECAAA